MRHELEELLKNSIRILAIQTRESLHLTQREMADRLYMAESSYSHIETGRSGGSALTLVLLLSMQDDPEKYLRELNEEIQSICIQMQG